MNEITRIHIAKVVYDIEIGAKKEIEKYIHKLELYADEQDWLADIEIRITELLAERGVDAGGVISTDDVDAIKEQLGEPREFLGDGDIAVGAALEDDNPHRLYRDIETAVLGGVLGGVAKYFGINPLWTRLGFIVLLLLSFGTASIVYVVLWLVVPPARTAAEKLQLAGEPVTLSSIKKLRDLQEIDSSVNQTSRILQNIIIYGFGVLFLIGALGALGLTIWGGLSPISRDVSSLIVGSTPVGWEAWTIYGLLIVSGLLLATLFSIAATMCFKKSLSKRLVTAVVVVIVAGIISFGTSMGIALYRSWSDSSAYYSSISTTTKILPEQFTMVKNLVIDIEPTGSMPNIEYSADGTKPRYDITTSSSAKTAKPVLQYSDDGTTLTLSIAAKDTSNNYSNPSILSIEFYGPSLASVTVRSGALSYHASGNPSDLAVNVESGSFQATGLYHSLTVATTDAAEANFEEASVENLIIHSAGGNISAGVIRNLETTQPDVCPANNGASQAPNQILIQAVSSGKMTFNGTEQPVQTVKNPCSVLIIGTRDIEVFRTE